MNGAPVCQLMCDNTIADQGYDANIVIVGDSN